MKISRIKILNILLSAIAVCAAFCVVCFCAAPSLVRASAEEEQPIAAVRADFTKDTPSEEFSIDGDYSFLGGLNLKNGSVVTKKKAKYFLSYAEVKADLVRFTLGETTLEINFVTATATFGGETATFSRGIDAESYGDYLLFRAEVLDGKLTAGVKTAEETLDFVYKDLVAFDCDLPYGAIGFSADESGISVKTIKILPYESNFTPEHRDYDPVADALPERVKKPVKNQKNNAKMWIFVAAGVAAIVVAAIVCAIVIFAKKRRKKKCSEK